MHVKWECWKTCIKIFSFGCSPFVHRILIAAPIHFETTIFVWHGHKVHARYQLHWMCVCWFGWCLKRTFANQHPSMTFWFNAYVIWLHQCLLYHALSPTPLDNTFNTVGTFGWGKSGTICITDFRSATNWIFRQLHRAIENSVNCFTKKEEFSVSYSERLASKWTFIAYISLGYLFSTQRRTQYMYSLAKQRSCSTRRHNGKNCMLNILARCTLNYSEYESNNNQNTHALVVSVSKVWLFCVCVCVFGHRITREIVNHDWFYL